MAQISTDEPPVSFSLSEDVLKDQKVELKTMPKLDMERIREEDENDEEEGMPPRFGYPQKVNFNLTNSGSRVILPNGDRIWQLSIHCPDALSI